MQYSRRTFLRVTGAAACGRHALAASDASTFADRRNFQYIFGHAARRSEFRDFLRNVFSLFPDESFDQLIAKALSAGPTDREVFQWAQSHLDEISPLLGDVRYGLPTLSRQKRVMAEETLALLGNPKRIEGYVEFGSTGRYLDRISEPLGVVGPKYTVSDRPPSSALPEIIDRGQIAKLGPNIPLNGYNTNLSSTIPNASLELVTVYIGFHHCPPDLREAFFASIRDTMKPGASMIVRDHQVPDEPMWRMVALAHDVFNLGTRETWAYNEAERRHFYTLETLDEMLRKAGFTSDGRRLLQAGDPTHNTLMLYRKA